MPSLFFCTSHFSDVQRESGVVAHTTPCELEAEALGKILAKAGRVGLPGD